jgi:hypothetical protein
VVVYANESFRPSDLNCYGLIDKYKRSRHIKQQLPENNPEEHHADTNVSAIWRHKILGRNQISFSMEPDIIALYHLNGSMRLKKKITPACGVPGYLNR